MDTPGFIAVVEEESARCADALRATPTAAPVPSCPDWTAGDLAYHLAEVQEFWAAVVADLLSEPESAVKAERPEDAALIGFLEDQSRALVGALHRRDPDDACWSWHDGGGSVGWVARRQAHEALIHRVDAELTAQRPVSDVAAPLAADGVDEVITVMAAGVPAWGSFTGGGSTIQVAAADATGRWTLEFGRFTGTSPNTGRTYDLDAAELRPDHAGADATAAGRAWDLDRWLWGRGDASTIEITGEVGLADRLRALIAESTG